MLSSLRFRLWLSYALLVGVVVVVAAVALIVWLLRNPYPARQEYSRLELVAALAVSRGGSLSGLSPAAWGEALKRADEALDARFAVYSTQGSLLADSRQGRAPALPSWQVIQRRSQNSVRTLRDEQRRLWLFTLRPLPGGETLLVAAPRPRFSALAILRDELFGPIARAGLLALGLSLLLAVWIARWIAGPLQRMAAAARSFSTTGLTGAAASNFQPLPLEGPRETRSLAQSFNEMAQRVQASQAAQRDFVANVSHDLKTPLTSIQGFSQAILDGTASTPEAVRSAAEVISLESGRMHRMVLGLLDLARLDSGLASLRKEPVELAPLVQRVVEQYSPKARQSGVSLTLELPAQANALVVVGDADRLVQVFSNLVDNALNFTPPGGQVTLHLERLGENAQVMVADTGPGLPPGDEAKVFDRFYQGDKSRSASPDRGAGLGLAIARQIVLAHGGQIVARNRSQDESEANFPAAGSVFIVTLPALPTAYARSR